ncbi:glycosyltransferase [Microvirga massiliensis]|uniref:glycosyltransferase n=1 Tax=Microvirga massiliensis TaxID=1033741 RepID=UPI00093E8577
MKVALLTATLSPAAGGLATSVPATAAALAELPGCEVHIVGTEDTAAPEAWRTWGRHVHSHRTYGPAAFKFAPSIGRTLRDLGADVTDVQGLWVHSSLAHLGYQRSRGRPYLITPRGMLDPWALKRSWWKKRAAAWWFEDAHLHGAMCLRATAIMEAHHFRSYGLRQPIAIVPNGVDLPALMSRTNAGDRRKRLLFLSRIHPKKGIPFLLRAWAALHRRHPDWELVIAGPEEIGHQRAMQVLAKELALPRVMWPGPAHGQEKDALYRSADLFVLPTHAENFGLVIAEALSYRIPVITTTNAPWAGVHEHDCGWWIDLADGPLIETLHLALGLQDATRTSMGARGRAWMERDFAWAAVGRQMLEVYHWAAAGGARPSCVLVD